MSGTQTGLANINPEEIRKNPNNPRRYFNDERLDLLRTSIQETGILVPLIAYYKGDDGQPYVLMDGERRWVSALELGLETVPVNLIDPPDDLQNLIQMFNIHAVREDWPLVSVALSLSEIMNISGEQRESRLAQTTGLTRSTVRRAKRLLTLPQEELARIQDEAHLDRSDQVHREDLYLEIEAADSVLRHELPEIAEKYPRERVIRQFARKREEGRLTSVTEFRSIGKLVESLSGDLVPREDVVRAAERLIEDVDLNPSEVFDEVAASAYQQQGATRKAELLVAELKGLRGDGGLSAALAEALQQLRNEIERLLR